MLRLIQNLKFIQKLMLPIAVLVVVSVAIVWNVRSALVTMNEST
jgi:hypothetical protein